MPDDDPTRQALTAKDLLERSHRMRPDVVAVRCGDAVFDVHTPLPPHAEIQPILKDEPEALKVIRHSSAHVMADAVQRLFPGTKVTIGPAIDQGFYYDFDRPQGQFNDEELKRIEQAMLEIIEADLPFSREEISRADAEALFTKLGETYKLDILEGLTEPLSLYRHGDWVDLCEGPHVPSTGLLSAVKLTGVAGAYWRGDERNKMLQRIYGTAFASPKALRQHLAQIEEAKKRDHRKLGKELDLMTFHPWAPASPFFLPRGATVYNLLIDYVRDVYRHRGYDEVITPQIFDAELFHMSGHLPSYAANMYFARTRDESESDEGRFCIKPMNCPGHALIFGASRRSYRELPMRLADFGRLHRYERSGVTQGLTRVRTFCQDDAHIFCTEQQSGEEISDFIDAIYDLYRDFGFSDLHIRVATRPEERLGTDAQWDNAERVLIDAVMRKGLPYDITPGEGVFYGPKLEFHLKDALGRSWQLGTIQFDFNMPERFDLSYVSEHNTPTRPVVLHRAFFGSIERFMGVLIEHVGGAFPVWLAPEQVRIVTVSEKFNEYGAYLRDRCISDRIRLSFDDSHDKLGAKIRQARLMRVPYIAVVGEKEAEGRGVALRSRDEDKDLGFLPIDAFLDRLKRESLPPSRRVS